MLRLLHRVVAVRSAVARVCCAMVFVAAGLLDASARAAERPNVLWIVSEDNGPHLGCFGDPVARTPNLDTLALGAMRYRKVWSTAPVCAPARTAIITGMYPSALGAEHMRSLVRLPPDRPLFPALLRAAGYYCSNNSKEDYNVEKPPGTWDESSPRAHWRNRRAGQPFFAVFNLELTHESQVRKRPHAAVHEPQAVRVPAYQPDLPEVRQDWAQYHDQMTAMDARAGRMLADLAADGLTEETIVFYYGDNGPGLPRSKRCLQDTGLHVPLIVRIPDRWRHLATADYHPGGSSDRVLGFVDFAPTVLSLAGVQPPAWMHGTAFLGAFAGPAPRYTHGLRGRMDERPDLARAVTDGRYVYIRNYHPHRPWGQHVAYMFETPTTRAWHAAFLSGGLDEAQSAFWKPRPAEELYDLATDPDEVRNVAGLPEYREVRRRLRRAQRDHLARIGDVGFLPEQEIHDRSAGTAPLALGHDRQRYSRSTIVAMAELAAGRDPGALSRLRRGLKSGDSAVRYWAAVGILVRGERGFASARTELRTATVDRSAHVRIVAAEALGIYGDASDVSRALDVLLPLADAQQQPFAVCVAALDALDQLDGKALPRLPELRRLTRADPGIGPRMAGNIAKLLDKIVADLEQAP